MLWHLFKKFFSYERSVIILCVAFYCICRILNITCLFYEITKIPCPACGMGRALISLIKGNIEQYVYYNIMAVPVAFAFISELFIKRFGKYKKAVHIGSLIILTFNIQYYLMRIYYML